jgi:hypothetical protein
MSLDSVIVMSLDSGHDDAHVCALGQLDDAVRRVL